MLHSSEKLKGRTLNISVQRNKSLWGAEYYNFNDFIFVKCYNIS